VTRARVIRIVAMATAVIAAVVAGLAVLGTQSTARPAAQAPAVAAPIAVTSSPPVTPTPTVLTTSMLSPASAMIATSNHRLAVARVPGGRAAWHLSARTELGAVRTLLVTAQRADGWLQVQVPVRPNGTRGWVKATSVTTSTTDKRVVVDRRAHTLTLLRDGVPVAHFRVAVGTSSTPTPAGLFFVSDRLPTLDPTGPFGPYALGLSGYSNVLTSFDGGDGVIGIHGTNADWSVGHAASHGCVRMHNSEITTLYKQVPLGTPVLVT
jgi:lipoprotein-anchoring transpeptidase ErfK/SrfK